MEGLNMNRPNSYNFTLIITGTIGLAAAAYIFLADFIPRKDNLKKKTYKKGILPGLENRGNTCFVNCILQALSSCYSFSTWLESAARHKPYPPLLLQSLDNILKVLNCQSEESSASAYQVLKALRSHGWVISSEEQDAHELFHALTSTLDDEILLLRKENSSLFNVSWVNTEQCNEEIFSTNFCKSTMNSSLTKQLLTHSQQQQPRFSQKDEFQKDISIISKVTSSLQQDSKKIDKSAYESPFKGYLASNLQCSVCGLKNAEQLSTFESISLSLSLSSWTLQKSLLLELLDAFVRPETVSDVSCEGCSKANDCPSRTTFSKQLTIRKLPDCLCIHVKRTIWMGNGCVVKRNDFVEFPEVLNMDPYTYSVRVDHRTLNGGLVGGRQSAATSYENCDKATSDANNSRLQFESCTPSQLKSLDSTRIPWKPHSFYKLRAVIVHVGDVFSGHFVTYRRGGLNTNMRERWFYTSDIVVREVSIEEVLQSNAYMLLYERYKI